jgi:hypothetical protein
MKIALIFLVCICGCVYGQDIPINVTFEKRTYLIFPANVHKYDCIESDSLVITKDENKVLVNARYDVLSDCNLIVETVDGYNYHFLVSHKADIQKMPYVIDRKMSFFKRDMVGSPSVAISEPRGKQSEQAVDSSLYIKTCRYLEGIKYENLTGKNFKKMVFVLGGVYIKQGLLFIKLMVENDSSLPFEVSDVAFILEESAGKVKKKAVQAPSSFDIEYTYNSVEKEIKKGSIYCFIYVLKNFEYTKEKKLVLYFNEKSKARNVQIEIPYAILLKAKEI